MSHILQPIAVAVSVALLVLVIELVRRRLLREEYALGWLVGTGVLLTFSWRGEALQYPPSVLMLGLLAFFVFGSLAFSIVISRQRSQLERLIEEVALLSTRVRELETSEPTEVRISGEDGPPLPS